MFTMIELFWNYNYKLQKNTLHTRYLNNLSVKNFFIFLITVIEKKKLHINWTICQ